MHQLCASIAEQVIRRAVLCCAVVGVMVHHWCAYLGGRWPLIINVAAVAVFLSLHDGQWALEVVAV